jgi:DNA-binding transcriptional ArsR family regulator
MRKSYLKSSIDWTVILKALCDESRLQIVRELLKKETPVNRLAEILDLRIYNVSRHLKILESSGLVEKRKDGNRRIYGISRDLKSHLSKNRQVLDLGCCQFKFKGLKR